jgi:uncharacterized repeat protein (TIGR03803 family)
MKSEEHMNPTGFSGRHFPLNLLSLAMATLVIAAALPPRTLAQGSETVLYSFNGNDGSAPYVGLTPDSHGNFYGTTYDGGDDGYGTAFELTPNGAAGWTQTILYSFYVNGLHPDSGLIFDSAGNLFGTTFWGGTYLVGTAFELMPQPDGSWRQRVIHTFVDDGSGRDGCYPDGNLISDSAGNLYGTTVSGGKHGGGTVFELTPTTAGGWKEKILHGFNDTDNGVEGNYPAAGVIFDSAGNLYGTTAAGGTYGYGIVFELTPKPGGLWGEKILYNFNNTNGDGFAPYSGLTIDPAGNLFGTTQLGGADGQGAVFELKPTSGGRWTELLLHSFSAAELDGAQPLASPTLDAAGYLYVTTLLGGANGVGAVFALKPSAGANWTETLLHSFGDGTDGFSPYAALTLDAAGNLYGTTADGGAYGYYGAVFEITP